MPVFEILECGLYQEKNGIYACQNAVEMCWKHGDMFLRYLLIFLSLSLSFSLYFYDLLSKFANSLDLEDRPRCLIRGKHAYQEL